MTTASISTTRYGIIGCGMMGQEHLRNIALLPGAQVTRIFEPDAAMLASVAAAVGGAQALQIVILPASLLMAL